jgi:hypothetical protein
MRRRLFVCLMVFNATFNNISAILWQSVLLVEETGVPLNYVSTSMMGHIVLLLILYLVVLLLIWGGCHGRDRMVVGFTTTYAIGAYYH